MEDHLVERLLGQLSDFGGLGCRAMFGGYGLFRGRILFGIVSAGRLYLKTSDATAREYAQRGMKPFGGGEREVLRTYYEVPADVLHDRRQLHDWAQAAAECAAASGPAATVRTARAG